MHTIDLLRGQGVPAKTTLGSIAILMMIVAVPILTGAVILDRYLHNKEVIAIAHDGITKAQETINKFAADVKAHEQMEQKRSGVNTRLAEVKSYLGDYVQWSPVLMTLVDNMPDDMVISKLTADVRRGRERSVQGSDPNRPANVNTTKRTLTLDIKGSAVGSYDSVVRDYGDRLKSSPELGPKLENIVVSQRSGQTGNDKAVVYTMNLIFKTGS